MEKLIIIRTAQGLRDLERYLRDKEWIAFDTETTGLKKGSEIIGYSVCAEVDVAYYVITAAWNAKEKKLEYLPTKEPSLAILTALKGKKLIMQNAPFDCRMVQDNYGVELMPYVEHDTLVSGHLLDENRRNGLKERGVELFGEDAKEEMIAMRQSVSRNGGSLTKACYELYKADAGLIAEYGAKDAILTFRVWIYDVEQLIEQKLDGFFYDDESMPLTRGPTYDLNTAGLRVDQERLMKLKGELQVEIAESKAFVDKEIWPSIKDKYPGTSKRAVFNPGSGQQLSWLLFNRLGNEFNILTNAGKTVCKFLEMKLPYTAAAKRAFIQACFDNKGQVYKPAGTYDPKTKKVSKRDAKIEDPYKYLSTGKVTLGKFAKRYKWVDKLLAMKKAEKLLGTYVEGIQEKMEYGIIRPDFKQCGTTSGRYSCSNPNFQNLPRDDKRVKACIISRPGMVFVGADYSQLEPRVFASKSGDEKLQACFASGDDFYSVVGVDIFEVDPGTSLKKDEDDPTCFAMKYSTERHQSKIIALAKPYGQTAAKLAPELGVSIDEAEEIGQRYFEAWPKVKEMQLRAHAQVRKHGVVYNLFGRPRRIPKALAIDKIYGKNTPHEQLPYEARTLLNLAVNHEIQSTGASIMNRAAIACWREIQRRAKTDARWLNVKIVLQVHDELILEGPAALAQEMASVLKDSMENTVSLPGVSLIAKPKIASNLADLK